MWSVQPAGVVRVPVESKLLDLNKHTTKTSPTANPVGFVMVSDDTAVAVLLDVLALVIAMLNSE